MVWSEYLQDTIGENEYSDEEPDHPPPRRLSIEEWTSWYSEDLLNMWFSMVQYKEDSGLVHDIGKTMQYTDFIEFMYRFSPGYI